jgi:hypothetical protein
LHQQPSIIGLLKTSLNGLLISTQAPILMPLYVDFDREGSDNGI